MNPSLGAELRSRLLRDDINDLAAQLDTRTGLGTSKFDVALEGKPAAQICSLRGSSEGRKFLLDCDIQLASEVLITA